METITIKAHPSDISQLNAVKAFMKALHIKFELIKERPYNSEFVNMIQTAESDIIKDKGLKITSNEFDNLWK